MSIFKLLWQPYLGHSKKTNLHIGFLRMPQINSIRCLSGIKAISKREVNSTSGLQDIAFSSNCRRTDGQTDGQTDRAIP